jgi:hypothetical protein
MTEMSDDELRTRLSRIDPAPAGSPVDPVTSPRAQELLERAMPTSSTQPSGMFTLDTPPAPDELAARRRRRPFLLVAAAAAVLVAAIAGGVLFVGGGDAPRPGEDPTTLALSLPPSDVAGSCVVFDVQFLAQMPVALAGTVTAIDEEQVTVDVDRWYRGGDADVVTIAVQAQNSVALDGVEFREGERYLITSTDGTVNGCGFSGPAEPQLERAYDEAFGG